MSGYSSRRTSSDNPRFPVVEVEWRDSESPDGGPWFDLSDATDFTFHRHHCHTVGYVMQETDECLVVALSHTDSQVGAYLAIPKENIVELHYLRREHD